MSAPPRSPTKAATVIPTPRPIISPVARRALGIGSLGIGSSLGVVASGVRVSIFELVVARVGAHDDVGGMVDGDGGISTTPVSILLIALAIVVVLSNSTRWPCPLSQQVVFGPLSLRGQKLPSAQRPNWILFFLIPADRH
jgi:hypothetical protein